jgi:glycosyltransferase involved in cell wall biosynthesis
MAHTYPRICLVAFFSHEAFFIPLTNIRKIVREIYPFSKSIITVPPELTDKILFNDTLDKVIIYSSKNSPLFRIINYFILNLKISWFIITGSKDNDCYLFFIETGLLLPMIAAKICKKRVLWLLPSFMKKMVEHNNDLSSRLLIPVQSISHRVTDGIILYSPNLIKEWELQNFSEKILIAHEHLVDTDVFTEMTARLDRPFSFGYIGRLSAEKGVRNFVRALPAILNTAKDIRVIIGGDGPLKSEIEEFLKTENLTDRVHLPGWIPHEELPGYLNKVQLLVLPSFTEGLPNIMLEAIACGTLMAATPVGAMPDIIRDGETGFVLKNNSPECITKTIISALKNPSREMIAENAKKRVKQQFTLENTVNDWKQIFCTKSIIRK